jgi:hypothetical protein
MKRSWRWAAMAGLLVACSDLPSTSDGVVELQVTAPTDLALIMGESAQLTARAFDASGAEVDAIVTWETPDETITLEPSTGQTTTVTAIAGEGVGRVQAVVGTLRSDLVSFSLQPAP